MQHYITIDYLIGAIPMWVTAILGGYWMRFRIKNRQLGQASAFLLAIAFCTTFLIIGAAIATTTDDNVWSSRTHIGILFAGYAFYHILRIIKFKSIKKQETNSDLVLNAILLPLCLTAFGIGASVLAS